MKNKHAKLNQQITQTMTKLGKNSRAREPFSLKAKQLRKSNFHSNSSKIHQKKPSRTEFISPTTNQRAIMCVCTASTDRLGLLTQTSRDQDWQQNQGKKGRFSWLLLLWAERKTNTKDKASKAKFLSFGNIIETCRLLGRKKKKKFQHFTWQEVVGWFSLMTMGEWEKGKSIQNK